jgi:hypothetical protein
MGVVAFGGGELAMIGCCTAGSGDDAFAGGGDAFSEDAAFFSGDEDAVSAAGSDPPRNFGISCTMGWRDVAFFGGTDADFWGAGDADWVAGRADTASVGFFGLAPNIADRSDAAALDSCPREKEGS